VTVAQYEVYLEAARNPALRSAVRDSMDAFAGVVAELLGSLGARDPALAAKALVAMADGCALHHLAAPQDEEADVELLFTSIQAIFLFHVLDEGSLDELRAPWTGVRG
jgi:TetR/AcrR family transcriptional regulator, regulator of biofilm formation and stress response